jgi:hypothetical protein
MIEILVVVVVVVVVKKRNWYCQWEEPNKKKTKNTSHDVLYNIHM